MDNTTRTRYVTIETTDARFTFWMADDTMLVGTSRDEAFEVSLKDGVEMCNGLLEAGAMVVDHN